MTEKDLENEKLHEMATIFADEHESGSFLDYLCALRDIAYSVGYRHGKEDRDPSY